MNFDAIVEKATAAVLRAFDDKIQRENSKFIPTEGYKSPTNEAVRNLMIRKIDQRWQQHLLSMDHLRSDVNLRTVGQRDPLTEFKHEAFRLFDEFGRNIRSEIAHAIFRFEMIPQNAPSIQDLLKTISLETKRSFTNEIDGDQTPPKPVEPAKPQPIVVEDKAGRNEVCPCGSGKKYKKCCGIYADDEATSQR
jgi:preprotein translocase subunit SecA